MAIAAAAAAKLFADVWSDSNNELLSNLSLSLSLSLSISLSFSLSLSLSHVRGCRSGKGGGSQLRMRIQRITAIMERGSDM
jgi:hypothetical protein